MNTRNAIHVYQYAERIKSELIIGSELFAIMGTLKGSERTGAEIMMTTFFRALPGEIRIAQGVEESTHFFGAEKKITEALGNLKLDQHAEINKCISEAVSLVTTSCRVAMTVLIDECLI